MFSPFIPTFAGLEIAPGPLFFNGKEFAVKDSWKCTSYGKAYGREKGSTFFKISQAKRISKEENLEGWRMPTHKEWEAIFREDRPGSTVNGRANVRYTTIRLKGVRYGKTTVPYGFLLFPDGLDIHGRKLKDTDNFSIMTENVTEAELEHYLLQGCVFLPATGMYSEENMWELGGTDGIYWSKSKLLNRSTRVLHFRKDQINHKNGGYLGFDDSMFFISCRPVRKPVIN